MKNSLKFVNLHPPTSAGARTDSDSPVVADGEFTHDFDHLSPADAGGLGFVSRREAACHLHSLNLCTQTSCKPLYLNI